jgi:hypothetical protein
VFWGGGTTSTVFLTTKDAPQEQLAFLRDELGFTTEQVGTGGVGGVRLLFGAVYDAPGLQRGRELVGSMCEGLGRHSEHCAL